MSHHAWARHQESAARAAASGQACSRSRKSLIAVVGSIQHRHLSGSSQPKRSSCLGKCQGRSDSIQLLCFPPCVQQAQSSGLFHELLTSSTGGFHSGKGSRTWRFRRPCRRLRRTHWFKSIRAGLKSCRWSPFSVLLSHLHNISIHV